MNPCPCGHHNNPYRECVCTPEQIRRYRAKISGPLLERIDLWVPVPMLGQELLLQDDQRANEYRSATLLEQVKACRELQYTRQHSLNNVLASKALQTSLTQDTACKKLLLDAITKYQLSSRAYNRLLKVARTIADLEQTQTIGENHLLEALSFRQFP